MSVLFRIYQSTLGRHNLRSGTLVRTIAVLSVFFIGFVAGPAMGQSEPMIMCPTAKIKGCQKIVDPAGKEVAAVWCPKSRCRVQNPKIVGGLKVCAFTCPEYFIE